MAYRAYLTELDSEGRQTLSVLSLGMLFLTLVHPLLLLLTLPTVAGAWYVLYRSSRIEFSKQLLRKEVLKRALRFDDYDPDLAESIEPGVHEGVLRFKHSQLENFWRSFEASCRAAGTVALSGWRHILWMVLPLLILTLGLSLLSPLQTRWNWLPGAVSGYLGTESLSGALHVLAWLLGIGAATLGKYVIQVALVNSAWLAVVNLPPDDQEGTDGGTSREEIITWHLPAAHSNGSSP